MKKEDINKLNSWFLTAKEKDVLTLSCSTCGNFITRTKHRLRTVINRNTIFCNGLCAEKAHPEANHSVQKPCGFCGSLVKRQLACYKASTSGHIFCSASCISKYNHKNNRFRKVVGTVVSKLEKWIASELTVLYPDLCIEYNKKDTINSELDIYIPSLKLAFELNGIFHYEPIYGIDKLNKIQNNDNRKFQACLEQGIELCIINSSKAKNFNPKKDRQYLDIITQIIGSKLSR